MTKTFDDLDLLPSLKETLAEKELVTLTEIQAQAIPALLEGESVVGVAETGGGKTLAYALPLMHLVKTLENDGNPVAEDASPRAVVLVPTRELGEQVTRVFKPFTHTTRIRVRSALGGTDMSVSKKNIAGKFEILIATPGRLVKLINGGSIQLGDTRALVFDEADQMLDAGFISSAMRIAESCARPQMALFSATVPAKVESLIQELFSKAKVIRSEGSHQVVKSLTTRNVPIEDGKRFPVLEKFLADSVEGGTIIFTNTREQCDKLEREMKRAGHSSVVYRGEMDKVERRKNLKLFREGKIPHLISTDLASRGLDVEHVGRVINYHLPQQMENYLHRVGRTARAGRKGLVVNFVTERDEAFVSKLDLLRSRSASTRAWPEGPKHAEKKKLKIIVKNPVKPS